MFNILSDLKLYKSQQKFIIIKKKFDRTPWYRIFSLFQYNFHKCLHYESKATIARKRKEKKSFCLYTQMFVDQEPKTSKQSNSLKLKMQIYVIFNCLFLSFPSLLMDQQHNHLKYKKRNSNGLCLY